MGEEIEVTKNTFLSSTFAKLWVVVSSPRDKQRVGIHDMLTRLRRRRLGAKKEMDTIPPFMA